LQRAGWLVGGTSVGQRTGIGGFEETEKVEFEEVVGREVGGVLGETAVDKYV
jgi:hypothetical protein